MSRQRYVSRELTHFIGRHLLTTVTDAETREDRTYELLAQILRTGRLRAVSPIVNPDPEAEESAAWKRGQEVVEGARHTIWHHSKDLDEMFESTVVCFCDIPVEDLGIHMEKYSRFGIAFEREFLLAKGANPVLYLAYDAVDAYGVTNRESFNEGARKTLAHIDKLMTGGDDQDFEAAQDLMEFLGVQLLPLIKPFEGKLPDDDEANYYMEREWRIYGHLDFSLDDVRRVHFPARFAKEFRDDFPEFYRQVTFSPEPT